MTRIFISYRRDDSGKDAGRLCDRLKQEFGADNVFKDTSLEGEHAIRLGHNYRDEIKEAAYRCDVLLALIGLQWLTVKDEQNRRKLDDPKDLLRQEIEIGLQRDDRLVIPVLVDQASMPKQVELPQSLHQLTDKQAILIRDDPDFKLDVDRLIASIKTWREVNFSPKLSEQISIPESEFAMVKDPTIHKEAAADAYNNQGLARRAQGDLAGAIADYDEAIRLDPHFADAYYNRGNAHFAQDDLVRALADYSKAIHFDPQLILAYNNRGLVRSAQGNLIGAIADYDKALNIEKNVYVYNNRGNAHRALGNMAGAIADYNEALCIDPQDASTYNNRGYAREQQSDLDGAIADYESALRIDPDHSYASNNLAQLLS